MTLIWGNCQCCLSCFVLCILRDSSQCPELLGDNTADLPVVFRLDFPETVTGLPTKQKCSSSKSDPILPLHFRSTSSGTWIDIICGIYLMHLLVSFIKKKLHFTRQRWWRRRELCHTCIWGRRAVATASPGWEWGMRWAGRTAARRWSSPPTPTPDRRTAYPPWRRPWRVTVTLYQALV